MKHNSIIYLWQCQSKITKFQIEPIALMKLAATYNNVFQLLQLGWKIWESRLHTSAHWPHLDAMQFVTQEYFKQIIFKTVGGVKK